MPACSTQAEPTCFCLITLPLIGFAGGAILWRDISYLQDRAISSSFFLLAIAAGIGSSMLVYDGTISHHSTGIPEMH